MKMETKSIKSARLNITQFTTLHHCIPSWITEVRKIFYEDLSKEQQANFDPENFEHEKIEDLFKKFDYVLVDEMDCFYGVKDEKKFALSRCDGAWQQAIESQFSDIGLR